VPFGGGSAELSALSQMATTTRGRLSVFSHVDCTHFQRWQRPKRFFPCIASPSHSLSICSASHFQPFLFYMDLIYESHPARLMFPRFILQVIRDCYQIKVIPSPSHFPSICLETHMSAYIIPYRPIVCDHSTRYHKLLLFHAVS
jgi:hypothetical protein